jgi:hypothetical protein
MNSFDVFDTLIARRTVTTHYVWQQLEKEFNIPAFASQRPIPDDGTKTFLEVYQALVSSGVISAELLKPLMDRELALEIEHSYPIQENMDRVNDGDMLISDMYLPAPAILQMVRAAGLNRQVTIYQSNADKGKGIVWKELMSSPPALHLGDNYVTDLQQPQEHDIRAELYTGSMPNDLEKSLETLGLLTREIRLRNNVTAHKDYFELACQINLPLIFVMAEQIHRKFADRPIVFLGRDCQLLWRIFNAYYRTAFYLPFSRKVAYTQPELAAEYIKSHSPDNAVLIDISSTGETWTHMAKYGNFDMLSMIYSDSEPRPYLPNTFSYLTTNSVCGQTNLVLEIMNCGDHGYLDSLEKLGRNLIKANFANTELPEEIIAATHFPVYDAVDLARFYKVGIRNQLSIMTDQNLASWFNQLSTIICSQIDMLTNLEEFHKKETGYHEQIIAIRKQIKNENN